MAIPEEYQDRLNNIVWAIENKALAVMEVTEKATGEPAYMLVVVVSEDEDESYVHPVARLDIDLNDFDAGENMETVTELTDEEVADRTFGGEW